jgi:hypothetical protein
MTSPSLPGTAEVLLVEDDPGDVLLTCNCTSLAAARRRCPGRSALLASGR